MRFDILILIICAYFVCIISAQNEAPQNMTPKHEDKKNETGLRCYACASTGGNNECEDYNTYKIAMEGKGNDRIKKNCSEKYSAACFIETYEGSGSTVSHIRGCSDDIHYSFFASLHQNKTSPYERFNDLKPDNETACVWDNKHIVCLTKCNTNFCNGPILEEVNASTVVKISSILMFAAVLAYKIF